MTSRSLFTLHFDRWLGGAVALVALLIVGLVLTLRNAQQASLASDWVTHSHVVMDAVSEVGWKLREAEAIQRTYLITGGDELPAPLEPALDATLDDLELVEKLTADNPSHAIEIAPLRQDLAELRELLLQTAEVRRDEGLEAARAIVIKGRSLKLIAQINSRLRTMDDTEKKLLSTRIQARDDAYRLTIAIGALSGLLGVAGTVAFIALLRRHLKSKEASAELLAVQRERLRITLASIGDAIITTDERGRVVDMNGVAQELTGWPQADAAGQPLSKVFDIINETTREVVPNPAERALREGVIVGLANHTILRSRTGAEHNIDDSAAPIRTVDGRVIGCVLVFRDISDRRSLERENAARFADAQTLAAIVATSNDAVIRKSLDGVVEAWNKSAERLFGYRADEIIGQPITVLFPPERITEEDEILAKLRGGQKIENFDTQRVRKDGTLIDVSISISPVNDDQGNIVAASKIVRDVTQQTRAAQALAESEERFRTLADNMSQFAWMTDAKGWIFWYNKRWYDFTGTTLEEMQGWGWRKVHHPDHVDRVVDKFQRHINSGEVWEDMFPLRSRTGEYRWFLSRALPIRDTNGNILRWLGTNTDITQQMEAEEALRQADQRKNEFLAMLAHELRNPLAPIRNGLELLSRESECDSQTLDLVQQQVTQLVRLVDDLLDVSRIMRGKIELRKTPVELGKLVKYCVESLGGLIKQRGQILNVNVTKEPLWLLADSVRLSQVVGNLLNNASKYSDHGGQIDLTVSRTNGTAMIAVRDTGIGIEPEFINNVFELFTQATRSIDRSQGGLGIGLTVVQQLVALHDGKVSVASDGLGKGSTFTVALPIDASAALMPADAPPTTVNGQAKPRRILIVDDNVGAAWMLSRLLAKLGDHSVETAHDGPTAIAKTLAFQPEVVFLDIGLPGMDGYSVASDIRSRPECKHVYLVALTGYGQEDDRRRSREAGFDRHLVKPADINLIEELLATL